jgi:hypothetical protein
VIAVGCCVDSSLESSGSEAEVLFAGGCDDVRGFVAVHSLAQTCTIAR